MKIYFLFLVLLFNLLFEYSFSTEKLIYSIKGKIGHGNYSQFTLYDEGNIKIEVITVEGDADLYVCDDKKMCEFTNYNLQSITYGVDEVLINNDLKRPISFSVYAHPYYQLSEFILNKYKLESASKSYETHENENHDINGFKKENDQSAYKSNDYEKYNSFQPDWNSNSDEYADDLNENESIFITILFHLINFLLEIVV